MTTPFNWLDSTWCCLIDTLNQVKTHCFNTLIASSFIQKCSSTKLMRWSALGLWKYPGLTRYPNPSLITQGKQAQAGFDLLDCATWRGARYKCCYDCHNTFITMITWMQSSNNQNFWHYEAVGMCIFLHQHGALEAIIIWAKTKMVQQTHKGSPRPSSSGGLQQSMMEQCHG